MGGGCLLPRLFPGLGTSASALENQACGVSARSEGYRAGVHYPVRGQSGEVSLGRSRWARGGWGGTQSCCSTSCAWHMVRAVGMLSEGRKEGATSSGLQPLTLASEARSSCLQPPFTAASPRLALYPWSTRRHPPLHRPCPPPAALLQLLPRGQSARRRNLPAWAPPWPSCGAVLPSSGL